MLRHLGPTHVTLPYLSRDYVVQAFAVASSAAVALPSGAKAVEIRAIGGDCWIRWGDSSVAAAAADATSQLFPQGEKMQAIPLQANGTPCTHFRVIRAATDGTLQVEGVLNL